MLDGFRRRRQARSAGPWPPRRRLAGCLLWIIGLIVVLIILSLLFGGFQKGTKADGPGNPGNPVGAGNPVPVLAAALLASPEGGR